MRPKLRHSCERCGLEAVFERAGRFRDEDFYEVFHELMECEAALKEWQKAYRELLREARDKIWALEHGISWRDFELSLRTAELKAAGVTPLGTEPKFADEESDVVVS